MLVIPRSSRDYSEHSECQGIVSDPSDRLAATALAYIVIIVGTILFRTPAFGNAAYGFDEQLYSLIGQRWLDGLLPYTDSWDRKPPGLFTIFALSHWLGGGSALAYQIPALAAAIAGSLLMHALARPFVSEGQSVLVALLSSLGLVLFGSGSAQSEVFFLPLLLGALLLLVVPQLSRRRTMGAMLLLGLALQVKYTILPFCIILGSYALVRRMQQQRDPLKLIQDALLFTAIGLLPTVAFCAYFMALQQFEPFWQANFVSFFKREGAGRLSIISFCAILLLAPPALGGVLTAWRSDAAALPGQYWLFCLFGLAATITVFFPGTFYLYYFATLVPASLLTALPLLQKSLPIRPSRKILCLAFVLIAWILAGSFQRNAADRLALEQLTTAIQRHVDTDRCLFIYDGPAVLYRLANACIPTRFVYPDHLNNRLERNALGTPQLSELAQVLRSRPQVIVSTPSFVTLRGEENDRIVAAALRNEYRALTTVVLQSREITVWLLKSR